MNILDKDNAPPFRLPTSAWLLLLLAAAGSIFALERWLDAGPAEIVQAAEGRPEPPTAAPRAAPTVRAAPAPMAQERHTAPGAAGERTSALELLREHWGERLEELLERNQASLEWLERFPIAELAPWAEVSEHALERALEFLAIQRADESYLLLSDERGLVDLPKAEVHLRAASGVARDWEPIRARAEECETALRSASKRYWDELERTLTERWRAGQIEHHPILASHATPPEDALYVQSGIAKCWAYEIVLRPADAPALVELAAELEALRRAYLDELARLLGAE